MGKLTCVNPADVRRYEPPMGGAFLIGVMTKADMVAVMDMMTKGRVVEAQWEACRRGVKGHEGLAFPDGTEVPFKTTQDGGRTMVAEETLQVYLATQVLDPVAAEAIAAGKGPKASG